MHPNTINNIAYNYCTDYELDDGKHLEKMKKFVKKYYPAKFNIYVYICDVIGRVEMHEKYFFVIFDVEENHELEKSMENFFFMNTIMSWRETEKKGHGYKMPNLFKKFKVWK